MAIWRGFRNEVRNRVATLSSRSKLIAHHYLEVTHILPILRFLNSHKFEWLLYSILLAFYTIIILVASIITYVITYYYVIPTVFVEQPVYFDFRQTEPTGFVLFEHSLATPQYPYDFELLLTVPDAPENWELGMFMVTLHLEGSSGVSLVNASRPTAVRYRSWFVRTVRTLALSIPLLLGLYEETQTVSVPLLERFRMPSHPPAVMARLYLSAQRLRLYSAVLRSHARLSGLSYMLYYWFLTSMLVSIPVIFGVLFVSCSPVVFSLMWVVGKKLRRRSAALQPRSPPSAPRRNIAGSSALHPPAQPPPSPKHEWAAGEQMGEEESERSTSSEEDSTASSEDDQPAPDTDVWQGGGVEMPQYIVLPRRQRRTQSAPSTPRLRQRAQRPPEHSLAT